MSKEYYIASYCHIKNNVVFLNGKKILAEDVDLDFGEFSKRVYKNYSERYSKFFKMDNLCKLAFLGTELIFKEKEIDSNTAIVLSNRASSLDTDRKHQESIQNKEDYYPSPAVFVYTLPNIAAGEISIRHQLKSENAFFVTETFNAELLYNYTVALVDNNKANDVLCGWVDYDENDYEAFLYLVSSKGISKHTIEQIQKSYKTV